ncbi:MAG TPA: MmcQ/YjbR family DNA-binding protein, partial [Mycobacteriales bacterium]|nr:MmcQ/YjbR family DNA-binding protein [Mycobacteriales bacterium]
ATSVRFPGGSMERMTAADEIRALALALPQTEEFVHFRQQAPGFRVAGAAFAGLEKGEATAVFSVALEEAQALIAGDAGTYEEVWRPGRIRSFVGVRVRLDRVSREQIRQLIEHAWANKAPKRLVKDRRMDPTGR